MNDHDPAAKDPNMEPINTAEMEAFIAKVREKAPFNDQTIDDYGDYMTSYESGGLDVAIFIPATSDAFSEHDEDITLTDSITVMLREEDPMDERFVMVKTRKYTVYLTEMYSDYSEESRVFDVQKGDWAAPMFADHSTESIINLYDTQQQLGLMTFTRARLDEVCRILDDLTPDDRI